MTRPVLILLNGAPASGKSTLARAWAESPDRDLPLALDVDVVRSMVGGWQRSPGDAGLAARALAIAAIRTHLTSGRDVVVPQYLRREDFIDQLAEAARSASAAFLECALVVDVGEAAERFERRRTEARERAGVHSPVVHGDLLGGSMAGVVDDFEAFIATRPEAVRLSGTLEQMLAGLESAVAAARQS